MAKDLGKLVHMIHVFRGHRVMIDVELAELYEVTTGQLNQAVSRNITKFPGDFMFTLTKGEKEELITNCDKPQRLRFYPALPKAFTEQGVAMLSGVLRSSRAIEVNIAIMRAFVRLRNNMFSQRELTKKILDLETRMDGQDENTRQIFEALRQLMAVEEKPKSRIGFVRE
jgi:hypothetical protein